MLGNVFGTLCRNGRIRFRPYTSDNQQILGLYVENVKNAFS